MSAPLILRVKFYKEPERLTRVRESVLSVGATDGGRLGDFLRDHLCNGCLACEIEVEQEDHAHD